MARLLAERSGNTRGPVVARPLRYPPGFPNVRPQEKGIDVQLAIDFVALAHDDPYDVGIIFSSETDLIPALEFVMKRHVDKTVEIGAWRGRSRLVARATAGPAEIAN